jgi:heat shock protein HslJ
MNTYAWGRGVDAARIAALLGLGLLAGCAGKDAPAPEPEAAAVPAGPPAAPTRDQLLAATVSGVREAPVTLAAGRWDGPPAKPGAASHPTLVLWAPATLTGDLDGQPGQETAAILSASDGGSGEFVHLAVFALRDGQAESIAVAPVGDRARLFRLWLERDKVHMDVAEAGPGEPACCGTQLSRKSYALRDGQLQQLQSSAVGAVSVNLLAATDWMLVEMDGQPLAEGVLPPTALFQYGKLTGFAGCRRYTVPLNETQPWTVKLGEVSLGEKQCDPAADAIEREFVARLGKVEGYTFQAGRLLLVVPSKEGTPQTLAFAR